MLSEWQGEDRAEDEAATASCSVDVEPIVVEEPAITVEERDAIDDEEFFLDKPKNPSRADQSFGAEIIATGLNRMVYRKLYCATSNPDIAYMYLGPRLEACVGVEGGVARQREEPWTLSPPLRTSSMICSQVSGRLAGFSVT